jgi:hypothetical protein
VGTPIAALLIHAARAAAATVAMLFVGIVAWFAAGFLSIVLATQSGKFVSIAMIVVGVAAICGGAFLSVRFITPRAILHPVLGALALSVLYLANCTSGDIGFMAIGIPLAAIVIAAAAAVTFRANNVAA